MDLTSRALDIVKIKGNLSEDAKKSAEDFLAMSQRYFDDAKFFEKKGDIVNAYGAIVYSHAFLDAGARIGLFDVGNDNHMFMVD